MQAFSIKAPDETWIVGIDFTPILTGGGVTITGKSVTIETAPGSTDSNPSAMLLGVPVLVGNVVNQMITGGLSGQTYILFFDIDQSNGEVLEEQAQITVSTLK